MTSVNDIKEWLELKQNKIRLELTNSNTIQEDICLNGCLGTINKIKALIDNNKIKEDIKLLKLERKSI